MKHDARKLIAITICFLLGMLSPVIPCFSNGSLSDSAREREYVIGPEDVLDIQVWGNDDMHRVVEVSHAGSFTFPFVDKVNAAGRSVVELEKLIAQKLSEGYFTNPQVTITVSKYKSQKVVVLGEVSRPGGYIIKGRTHILEIISEAGGFTERAGRMITIMRTGDSESAVKNHAGRTDAVLTVDLDQLVNGDSELKYYVENGDTIYVSKAHRIFVIGEVNRPGEFKWDKGLTVNQAISLAGGATKRGAPGRAVLTRMEQGAEVRIKPKLSDPVSPDDIIEVPQSYF